MFVDQNIRQVDRTLLLLRKDFFFIEVNAVEIKSLPRILIESCFCNKQFCSRLGNHILMLLC